MKKAVIAILCLLTLASVGVAKADQVRFYSLMPDGVELAKDIHYTVLTLEGVKVAEKSVTFEYGVTINDLPNGTYFLSAEQPSTGYFGSRKIEITGDAIRMWRARPVRRRVNPARFPAPTSATARVAPRWARVGLSRESSRESLFPLLRESAPRRSENLFGSLIAFN